MAQVTVTVNNRNYTLACDDGEEAHLIDLASQIDKRHEDLVKDVGPTGDARLMLMAGLTLADDLALASERIADLEEELAGLKDDALAASPPKHANGKGPAVTFDEEKFAGILESAARRLEDIAGRLS